MIRGIKQTTFLAKHGGDFATFNLIDKATVGRLARDGKVKVPVKSVNVAKDKRWNEKLIGSQILQGIERGDAVDKIADRIFPEIYEKAGRPTDKSLVDRCIDSAMRNARTMTTSAENHGRLDSYNELASQGVHQRKVWVATPDERTREEHLLLDGEEVNIDEPFSNGLMFPGDGDGPPEEVWNCRCTMRDHIVGFEDEFGQIHRVDYDRDETMHDKQIEDEKERRTEEKEEKHERQESPERERPERERPERERLETETANTNEPSRNPDDYAKWREEDNRKACALMDITQDEHDMVYGWDGYIRTANSFDINYAMRYDAIDTLSDHNQEVINTLTNVINRNELSEDVRMVRMVGGSYMQNTFGIERDEIYSIVNNFDLYKEDLDKFKGLIVEEKGFMSVSTNVEQNVFTDRPVQLDILAPKGTPAYVTSNYDESEVVLRPNAKYEILDFGKEENPWGNDKLIVTILMR